MAVTQVGTPMKPRQLVLFRVADTHYAVDIDAVDEILPVLPITPLPGAPGGVMGLADVRKRVVPVFDLHWRFGVSSEENSAENRLILVENDEGGVALLVDAVEEVLTVSPDDYQQVDAPGNKGGLGYLNGVIRRDDRLVLWIDHQRVVPTGIHPVSIAA